VVGEGLRSGVSTPDDPGPVTFLVASRSHSAEP
jgi:hypothetical protein